MLAKNLKSITLEEFNTLVQEDGMTYELIKGVVLMSPRPNIKHQKIQAALLYRLATFLDGKNCDVISETEIEVEQQIVVPDLFVYCDDITQYEQRYKGVPLVVIEVLSKSTAFTDLNRKNILYQKIGVEEYWILSPISKSLTIHNYRLATTEEFDSEHVL